MDYNCNYNTFRKLIFTIIAKLVKKIHQNIYKSVVSFFKPHNSKCHFFCVVVTRRYNRVNYGMIHLKKFLSKFK